MSSRLESFLQQIKTLGAIESSGEARRAAIAALRGLCDSLAREEAPVRVEELKRLVRRVLVAPHVERYAASLVRLTAPATSAEDAVRRYVAYGASPRGGQALLLGGKVMALLAGRPHVSYEDVDRVAPTALRHRLVMNFVAESEGVAAADIIARVVAAGRRLRGRRASGPR